MLKLHLGLIDTLQGAIDEVDATVGKALAPIQARAQLLTMMPGVSDVAASVIVAVIGVEMSRFPLGALSARPRSDGDHSHARHRLAPSSPTSAD